MTGIPLRGTGGRRVKQVLNGVTTYFIGNYYEVTGTTVTKYYYAGAQRVAMRKDNTLYYFLSDHLGSTSLTLNTSGQVLSEMRYGPCPSRVLREGNVRSQSGTTPTQYQYTGQYSYQSDFGLQFYNARWYDSALGRFVQADTIVPGGVQGYDRYAYVQNNPLRYTDPTGHRNCEEDGYHCPGDKPSYTLPKPAPAGNQIQINIMGGITLNADGLDGNNQTVGFLYYSFSVVTDNKGNVQFYVTSLDQEYIEGSESPTHMGGYQTVDPVGAEKDNKDSAYGLGASLGWGMIDGDEFRSEGTPAYEGKAVDTFLGVDVLSIDGYMGLDDNGNPSTGVVGADIAASIGVPVSMGTVTINSVPINRNPIQIPSMFIPMCQGFGMCGSSNMPGSQFYP